MIARNLAVQLSSLNILQPLQNSYAERMLICHIQATGAKLRECRDAVVNIQLKVLSTQIWQGWLRSNDRYWSAVLPPGFLCWHFKRDATLGGEHINPAAVDGSRVDGRSATYWLRTILKPVSSPDSTIGQTINDHRVNISIKQRRKDGRYSHRHEHGQGHWHRHRHGHGRLELSFAQLGRIQHQMYSINKAVVLNNKNHKIGM